MRTFPIVALILLSCLLTEAANLSCVAYSDTCRAAFCLGGFKVVNTETDEAIASFRNWDFPDFEKGAQRACESYIADTPPLEEESESDSMPSSELCNDFEWRFVSATDAPKCTRSFPARCSLEIYGYSFEWAHPGEITSCLKTKLKGN